MASSRARKATELAIVRRFRAVLVFAHDSYLTFSVAGRTILPSIIHYLERIADEKDPLRFAFQEISYKPFISLFNLTGLDERYPDISGIREFEQFSFPSS